MTTNTEDKMPTYTEIGQKMLDTFGEKACDDAYSTTDPHWIGRFAVRYGDADRDGTLN